MLSVYQTITYIIKTTHVRLSTTEMCCMYAWTDVTPCCFMGNVSQMQRHCFISIENV